MFLQEAVLRYLRGLGIENDQEFRVTNGFDKYECKLMETGLYIKSQDGSYKLDFNDKLGQKILYQPCHIAKL
jgi:hypothetical protein